MTHYNVYIGKQLKKRFPIKKMWEPFSMGNFIVIPPLAVMIAHTFIPLGSKSKGLRIHAIWGLLGLIWRTDAEK